MSVDTGHEKKKTKALQETLMYEIQFHSLEIYGWRRDDKISKEQGGQPENNKQKEICSSVGNISGTFHIQANKVPTFSPLVHLNVNTIISS